MANKTIGILNDVVFSMRAGGADDGVMSGRSYGSSGTVKMDKVKVDDPLRSADFSTGQDPVPLNRMEKNDWSIEFETTLQTNIIAGGEQLQQILQKNAVIEFTATASDHTITGVGLLSEFTPAEYGMPSKIKGKLIPYGSALVYTWF